MLQTFLISFRLRNTYKVNTIIYALKSIPGIRKILPDKLYQSKVLKIIGNIISVLLEIANIFIGKFLYVFLMIFSMMSIYKTNSSSTFLHILVFLTIIGAFMNTYMFNPTKDKYYAMFIMRMNAKNYSLSNYFYAIIKVIIGFLPFTIIFGTLSHVNLGICLFIPLFVAYAKMVVTAHNLSLYAKKEWIINENNPVKHIWLLILLFLGLAYGLPAINIVIPSYILVLFMIITVFISIWAIRYILKFNKYREMYKAVLTNTNMNVTSNAREITKENVLKQINIDKSLTSKKKGFAYFNDLFVMRHSKLLLKSAKKVAFISAIIIGIILLVVTINDGLKKGINDMIMTYLPYFVFIMYLINRGESVTRAMFMNSDHSMLTYAFFRKPNSILKLFRERLKSIILINLLPASIIGVGLAFILFATGGTTNNLNYLILIISIIAMSIFFSVHHLVIYYLLQPYNIESETKNTTYTIVNFLTYVVCYWMIDLRLPTFGFGLATIIFAIIYSFVSLYLVYKFAPKTFKIRI